LKVFDVFVKLKITTFANHFINPMFSGLKNKSILRSIDSQIKKRELYNSAIQLKKLAVLIDAREDVDIFSIVKLADKLGVKSSQLKIMGFKDVKAHVEEEKGGHTNYFDEKMVNYGGGFKSKTLANFVEESFDVIINFYEEDHKIMNLVAASSKAKFKVGFASVDNRINDLVIGTPSNNTDLFISELKKYLKILNII